MKEIENRRSIRKFRSQKIEREIIDNILKAGIDAPSAKNRQPWKFVVLEGNAKKQFSEIMKQGIQEERSRHYPRYSTIRGNFQIVAIYKDFKEISSDNLSLHDTVKVTKENRRL